MFTLGLGTYQLLCLYDGLPGMLAAYVERAALADQIDIPNPQGKFCFIAVRRAGEDWPSLVIAQRYQPADGVFFPGALLVPETNRLFIGAGSRLLCYDIAKPARLWEDRRVRLLVVDTWRDGGVPGGRTRIRRVRRIRVETVDAIRRAATDVQVGTRSHRS